MSQVTQQIATEKSEKAVELRDNGDIAGARKVLEENADVHQAVARRVHLGRGAGAAGLRQRAQRSGEAEPRGRQQPRRRRLGPHAQDHALRPAQGQGAAGVLTNDEGTAAVPGFDARRRLSYSLKGTTFERCSPRPSTRKTNSSPAFRYSGGFLAEPTPGGVPVVTTSPGSSTMNWVM